MATDLINRRLDELRPLASVSRVASLSLCGLAIWAAGGAQPWLYGLLAGFLLWSGFTLWRELTGRGGATQPAYFAVVMLTMVALVRGTEQGVLMVPLVIHPLTVVSLLHGWRRGLGLAAVGAAGLLLSVDPWGIETRHLLPALGLLLVPPFTAVVAQPVAALRQRVQLAARLERELDPRRGVQAVGLVVAERLREATGAQQVLLCHREAEVPTVLVADQDDQAYAASSALVARVLPLLAQLPPFAMAWQADAVPGRALSSDAPAAARVGAEPVARQLAELLGSHSLQLVPDAPGEARAGWLLLVHARTEPRRTAAAGTWPLVAVAAFAQEMRRLVQQASYVDRLQDEIAAHERARIGRDLHDSAVQPYLGLKFAIEVVAQRCAPDNPLHEQVQDLRRFCEAELNELRDTVAVLRTGDVRGDSSLAPALRRQAQRFASLFGIQTHLDLPEPLVTSRALSGAVLHMVNEALNNVRRHTQARTVWVQLLQSPGRLELLVRDDAGQRSGFPAPSFEPGSLAERARELGGTLALRRHNGLDTEVHISLPV